MSASARPGDRPVLRTLLSVTLPCAVLCAVVAGWAVSVAPASARIPLAWGAGAGAFALCAAVTLAGYGLRSARAVRRALDAATGERERLAREQARAAEQWRHEQQRLADTHTAERARLTQEFERERIRLAQEHAAEKARLAEENGRLSARLDRAVGERAAALSATAGVAARMQALATATLADLRAMEERHSDEDVLTDLLHLDHRTAQAGRLADSIAVLTGARSGRRWARPIGMESVLRGAMGRISGYQRIRLHSVSGTAVAGHAAEGVMHALAEILDNAANFSPPTTEVHVYVEEVPAGVIVSVEDSGLVMGEVQLRRAEQAVSGEVSGLGGLTGTRLGLAVVGRLARKHGLKVSFRPSARGGTGVLVLIPQDVLAGPEPGAAGGAPTGTGSTAARRTGTAVTGTAPGPSRAAGAVPAPPAALPAVPTPAPAPDNATPPAHASPEDTGEWPARLPRRRRGRTLAAAERARAEARTEEQRPTASAEDVRNRAARFGSFRQAVRAASAGTGADDARGGPPETAEQTSDHPSHSHAHPEGDPTT